MAKLKLVRRDPEQVTLVYGMRLFPHADVTTLGSGTVTFAGGEEARVTLHVIEGTRAQVKRQLAASVDAFFDIYGGGQR